MTGTESKVLQIVSVAILLIATVLAVKFIPRGDEKENKFDDENMK
jgi:hypothetical protein